MDYDLLVLGSGSAAFAAGIEARSLGASVALVEREVLGGTCVNVGCVPSKTLLAAAEVAATARDSRFAGVRTTVESIDLQQLIAQKNQLVASLRQAKYADVAQSHGIEILRGDARFIDANRVLIGEHAVTASSILIATGAGPAIPSIPGLDAIDYLTSTTAMELKVLPERLVVIGAGFVGVEQAQLFARLGSQVTLIGPLLPSAEPELVAKLEAALIDEGIVRCGSKAVRVDKQTGGIAVTCDDGSIATGDRILGATGRQARTAALDLDRAGVEVDERGHVKIDNHQQTTNPNVWAAGDVAAGLQFVYVAATSGKIAARNALTGSGDSVDFTGLPHVAFTSPQLAWSGRTETEAKRSGHDVETRILPLDYVPRAIANRDTRGAIKLVADATTHRLLGAHVLADHGGELLLPATIAIQAGWTVERLAATWAPYLTMSEGLKLAAQSFTTNVEELSCCAS